MCVNTAEELFYKTRSTNRGIPTLLCVLILQRSSSTRQGAPEEEYLPCCVVILQRSSSTRQGEIMGVYLPCCVWLYCRGALLQDNENQWVYIYPVVCGYTAEEFFYKTRSTSRSISTLLCVVIQQRSSSTRQGATVAVYLPCCVWLYCRGDHLPEKDHQ